MRIVAGRWRGRKIEAPSGRSVRPTLDRVREAWMSILQKELTGARVLDLFAGSGALGLEAISRGAASADLVENDPRTIRVLRRNLEVLGAENVATIHRSDAILFARSLGANSFDVAFADPPYDSRAALDIACVWLDCRFASTLSIEHDAREALPDAFDTRRYGSSAITFYRNEE